MSLAKSVVRRQAVKQPPLFGWRGFIVYTALLVLMAVALYMIFIYAPAERVQGDAHRLLYGHVAVAWLAFLAFGVVAVASVMYLWRRNPRWDSLAVASAEVGVLFTTLTLISGSIWGRHVWGVWWTWDPRLTTTLVLWFIYVAYLALRMYIDNADTRRRVAAIFGIVGFVDVPIVWYSVEWWRSLHPVQSVTRAGLTSEMVLTLVVTVVAFTVFCFVLIRQRYLLERASDEGEGLRDIVRNRLEELRLTGGESTPEAGK